MSMEKKVGTLFMENLYVRGTISRIPQNRIHYLASYPKLKIVADNDIIILSIRDPSISQLQQGPHGYHQNSCRTQLFEIEWVIGMMALEVNNSWKKKQSELQ